MFVAKVYVSLKPAVNDPQGTTVLGGLHSLGFATVTEVRVGKFLEVKLDESDPSRAQHLVAEMCEKLLANPVIEQFSVELAEEPE